MTSDQILQQLGTKLLFIVVEPEFSSENIYTINHGIHPVRYGIYPEALSESEVIVIGGQSWGVESTHADSIIVNTVSIKTTVTLV